jgi:hypothetical protein
MKPKFLLSLMVLIVLLLVTAACEPYPDAPTDKPEAVPTVTTGILATTTPAAPVSPTSTPAAAGSATTAPNSNPTATALPVPSSSPTTASSATPTTSPTTGSVHPTVTQPTATTSPLTDLQVIDSTSFLDSNNDFHVVGEVKNNTTHILNGMQLTIVIKDAAGNSLLKDTNNNIVASLVINPILNNLASGETSPFSYTLFSGSGAPDPKSVSVAPASQKPSDVKLAAVEIQHAQMSSNGQGNYLLSGMIVNKSSTPVEIHNLAAALLDNNKKVIAADYSVDYSVYLLPSGDPNKLDSTPFYLRMTDPPSQPADWKIYLDAEEVDQAIASSFKIYITNHFFDSSGAFHIVGTVTNTSTGTLTARIVAGLYDKNGAVLDAYSTGSPVNLAANEIIPYDVSTFENVNANPGAASALDHFTVQIDNYYTSQPNISSVALTSTHDAAAKDGNVWTVTGQVTNNSGKALSIETIVVGIYDRTGKLMAVNSGWILPSGDTIANDSVDNYSVVVSLDPAAVTTDYTLKTLVKGELK